MAKIIVTSRYMRNAQSRSAANLLRYMATREGVEKVPAGTDRRPTTVRQERAIRSILSVEPDAETYPEYLEWIRRPTRASASDFIDAFAERNADRLGEADGLVRYMAERPGVEKLGAHGLFSQTDDRIDLRKTAEKVGAHRGILWTHVVSLHREDAERLGYNNAEAWKSLVRRNVTEIAEAHRIDLSNLQWYAAFHDTAHHPHIHLLVYAKDGRQGYLSKKGIERLRAAFGGDIFRNEQYKLFTAQTALRDTLKEKIRSLLDRMEEGYSFSEETTALFLRLAAQLRRCKGRKQYGYLPPDMKQTVDAIVALLSKEPAVAEIYREWNRVDREKLSLYHEKGKPDVPLERNPEFRSVKNAVIRAAVQFGRLYPPELGNPSSQSTAQFLSTAVLSFLALVQSGYEKKRAKLHRQVDRRIREKMAEKKRAHGVKPEFVPEPEEEDAASLSMQV